MRRMSRQSVYRQVKLLPNDGDASEIQDKRAKLPRLSAPTAAYEVQLKDDSIFFDVMKTELGMTEKTRWNVGNMLIH